MTTTTIRAATKDDAPALGRLAAELVRQHHAMDPERFVIWEPIEEGYGRWLARESANADAIVLVAERDGAVIGYVYGTMEGRDWMALRDACGVLQDILVAEGSRRGGTATALVHALTARMKARGAPRVVLTTAARNEAAQRFFDGLGFRRTMIELTKELGAGD